MRFSRSRSDYSVARKAVVQPSSRQQGQRRLIQCFVFLEDDAIAESATARSRSETAGVDGSYTGVVADPMMSTALTDAQLRAAITDICGPNGFRTTDENEDEQDEIEDASPSYNDIWTSSNPDEDILPRHQPDRFNGSTLSENAGRADVRALRAMETRLEKSKLSEIKTDESDAVLAVHTEDAEGTPPVAEATLLPDIQHPCKCSQHRLSGDTDGFLQQMTENSKFLDRWTIFSTQLRVWGYYDHKVPTLKRTMTSFARSNPDLLYMLPARQLHIFVKKFRAFPSRSLDRKFRAAANRLANVYVDFQIQATFNGNACFQDVTRLLMFVATAEFSEIEQTAPGIVAAASDLLLEVLIAGTQPPSELARDDHSAQWRDMRDSVAANTARNPTRSRKKRKQRKQKRSSELHDEEAELAAERRLESMEEKLAASLRKGTGSQGSSRPWTPWDAISSDSAYGSNSTSKATRRKQRDSSDRAAGASEAEDRSRGRHSQAEVDAWGAPDAGRKRVPRDARDGSASRRASRTPAQQQQRHKRGSKSLVDFMSMVGDSANASTEKSRSKESSKKPSCGGYGQKASGYSGGIGLL